MYYTTVGLVITGYCNLFLLGGHPNDFMFSISVYIAANTSEGIVPCQIHLLRLFSPVVSSQLPSCPVSLQLPSCSHFDFDRLNNRLSKQLCLVWFLFLLFLIRTHMVFTLSRLFLHILCNQLLQHCSFNYIQTFRDYLLKNFRRKKNLFMKLVNWVVDQRADGKNGFCSIILDGNELFE